MCRINLNEKLHFFGFGDNAATPVPGEAMPSIPTIPNTQEGAACTYDLREATEDGDSGSPVVNGAGLLVGVIIQNRNQSRAGRFVPTKCFASWLCEVIEDDVVEESISFIANKPVGILTEILKPPRRTEWLTNLRLASAINKAAHDKDEIHRIRSKHQCPIRWAIIERGLGMDLYDRYFKALIASASRKEEAEDFQSKGEMYETVGNPAMAFTLYHAAIHNYEKFVNEPSDSKTLLLVAQAYKGMADTQTRLADLSGTDDFLFKARTNSVLAALLTPGDNPAFKGSAIAAFGVASQKAGDLQTAIEAYSSAVRLGYKTPWMSQNYQAAFMSRDKTTRPTAAPDYAPLGLYKALSDHQLKGYLK